MTNEEMDQFEGAISTVLKGVRMLCDPDLPRAVGVIELEFESASIGVWVDGKDDTLVCTGNRPDSCCGELPITFWSPIIGMSLVQVWSMTNDRGYRDGFQMLFRAQASEGPYRTIQLYGEASQITVSEHAITRQVSIRRPSKT